MVWVVELNSLSVQEKGEGDHGEVGEPGGEPGG